MCIRDRYRGFKKGVPACAGCHGPAGAGLPAEAKEIKNARISNIKTSKRKIVDGIQCKNKKKENTINTREIKLSLIHISEPTRLGMISYAVFCLKKKKKTAAINMSALHYRKQR
eukprot:TRINITY_DN5866_c1_g4_i8.p3 TRINITY_DN5866_c1_g4~~TRINITY_DN5866_c1_g4_i8.p3  ORF type:complete len:114 (-),score=17.69 TRINITY_DN5866_c1_g4_i8:6-347(-)